MPNTCLLSTVEDTGVGNCGEKQKLIFGPSRMADAGNVNENMAGPALVIAISRELAMLSR